jgi:hypothetical protein
MTGTGEDRARAYFDQARALLGNTTITPGERAIACACMAQAAAVIDIRDALTGHDPERAAEGMTEFEGSAGSLAYELKRFNDGHGF